MRRIREILVLTLIASMLAALVAHQLLKLERSLSLPNTSFIQTTAVISEEEHPTSGGTTIIEPVLDGTLQGYDVNKLETVLDDPCPEWHTPFLLAGWDESEWDTAKWIIYRESRCNPLAFNGVDAGLLQINEIHRERVESYGLVFPDSLFDGETNLWVANMLWMDYGWLPWKHKGVVPGE